MKEDRVLTTHYPLPTPSRRIALGLVQGLGLAAGPMALILFRAGRCLSFQTAPLTYLLLVAAFLPLTLTVTWRGPGPMSRVMKFATFAFFFLSILILTLAGPDSVCGSQPSAVLSGLYVALAGILLWAGLYWLGPKGAQRNV